MDSVMSGLLVQIACYGGLMFLTIFGIAFFLKGFFFEYFKVRTSFGRYILVKIRTPIRDYYKVGWVEENFLCYKDKDFIIRIAINTNDKIFYRSLGVMWVDIDEEKNAICKTDYSTVTGFDAKKHSDLLTRALMRPAITSNQEKIILVCVILAVVISIAGVYFAYKASANSSTILVNLPAYIQSAVDQGIKQATGGISGTGVTGVNTTAGVVLT